MAKIKKTMKGGAKGGKGGGKKGKSNESDEERQMRLESERLREEEARRAMEAMRKEMIKKRLAQEERYSRINNLKINTRWRTLMRLVKTEAPWPLLSSPLLFPLSRFPSFPAHATFLAHLSLSLSSTIPSTLIYPRAPDAQPRHACEQDLRKEIEILSQQHEREASA